MRANPTQSLSVYEDALDRYTAQLGERLNLIDQAEAVVIAQLNALHSGRITDAFQEDALVQLLTTASTPPATASNLNLASASGAFSVIASTSNQNHSLLQQQQSRQGIDEDVLEVIVSEEAVDEEIEGEGAEEEEHGDEEGEDGPTAGPGDDHLSSRTLTDSVASGSLAGPGTPESDIFVAAMPGVDDFCRRRKGGGEGEGGREEEDGEEAGPSGLRVRPKWPWAASTSLSSAAVATAPATVSSSSGATMTLEVQQDVDEEEQDALPMMPMDMEDHRSNDDEMEEEEEEEEDEAHHHHLSFEPMVDQATHQQQQHHRPTMGRVRTTPSTAIGQEGVGGRGADVAEILAARAARVLDRTEELGQRLRALGAARRGCVAQVEALAEARGRVGPVLAGAMEAAAPRAEGNAGGAGGRSGPANGLLSPYTTPGGLEEELQALRNKLVECADEAARWLIGSSSTSNSNSESADPPLSSPPEDEDNSSSSNSSSSYLPTMDITSSFFARNRSSSSHDDGVSEIKRSGPGGGRGAAEDGRRRQREEEKGGYSDISLLEATDVSPPAVHHDAGGSSIGVRGRQPEEGGAASSSTTSSSNSVYSRLTAPAAGSSNSSSDRAGGRGRLLGRGEGWVGSVKQFDVLGVLEALSVGPQDHVPWGFEGAQPPVLRAPSSRILPEPSPSSLVSSQSMQQDRLYQAAPPQHSSSSSPSSSS